MGLNFGPSKSHEQRIIFQRGDATNLSPQGKRGAKSVKTNDTLRSETLEHQKKGKEKNQNRHETAKRKQSIMQCGSLTTRRPLRNTQSPEQDQSPPFGTSPATPRPTGSLFCLSPQVVERDWDVQRQRLSFRAWNGAKDWCEDGLVVQPA